ncbi:MAG: hypothetical protein U5N55_11620 [Cypionkella sp.]|nr:hypothetical protein [Cypionkella sp.]
MTVAFPPAGPGLNGVDTESFVSLRLVGLGASAGRALDGSTITVASNSAHWAAEVTYAISGEGALTWQGFLANMQGAIGETLVPAWSRAVPLDGQFRPVVRFDPVYIGQYTPLADNTGVGFSPYTHAVLTSAAALRDTILNVTYVDAAPLRPGHRIGIQDRLHDVLWVTNLTSTTARIRVNPPMRQAYDAGERVILDTPVCRMKFASPNEGIIPYRNVNYERVTVRFMEALP